MRYLTNLYHGQSAVTGNYITSAWGEVVMNAAGSYFKSDQYSRTWVEIYNNVLAKEEVNLVKKEDLGLRYNKGKTKFSLIPAHWTRVLAQILTKGAEKYAPRNWEKGLVHSEVLDSLYRHLDAFLSGERYDPETKCHHLGHVAWNALALMTFDLNDTGSDDLPEEDLVRPTMEE